MNGQRDLEGVSALVTGASSGIGRAAAEELGRQGAEVVVHGRDAARGSAVVDTITAEGGKARFVAADLTDLDQLDDLVDQAGTVDVLVNNAGFSWFGPTGDLDVATFDRLFAANVRAPYFLVGALAPKMAARGSGSIVNIGSVAGQIGLAGGAAYGATKATLVSMTRSWTAEFSPSGVRVNAIAAGPVLTPGAAPGRMLARSKRAAGRPTPWGAKRGANDGRHQATPGHCQRSPSLADQEPGQPRGDPVPAADPPGQHLGTKLAAPAGRLPAGACSPRHTHAAPSPSAPRILIQVVKN